MFCSTFIIRRLGTIGGYNKSLIKVIALELVEANNKFLQLKGLTASNETLVKLIWAFLPYAYGIYGVVEYWLSEIKSRTSVSIEQEAEEARLRYRNNRLTNLCHVFSVEAISD